jgi:hypothetical protein
MRSRVVEVQSYRSCRIEITEHSRNGWTVRLFAADLGPRTFATERPNKLADILAEARSFADALATQIPSARLN